MTASELQEKTKEELEKMLGESRAKLIQLRFDVGARQHKNHQDIKATKKDIARMETRLREIESNDERGEENRKS